jgi:O-antigen biosynthesis protein WbqV
LHEELLHVAERLVPTRLDGILLAAPRLIEMRELATAIDHLAEIAETRDSRRTIGALARLVPEYRSDAAALPDAVERLARGA